MTDTIKPGFYPLKTAESNSVNYVNYQIVPGIFISGVDTKPIQCWATFNPSSQFMGWNVKFLDAKERVKIDRISKFEKRKKT
jgi:hypothetical protein